MILTHAVVNVLLLCCSDRKRSLFIGWVWNQLRWRGQVGLDRHDQNLDYGDEERYSEVKLVECFEREEGWVAEVDLLVDEEDCGGGVESACEEGQDQAGLFWECVGQLEGGDV